MLLAPTYRDRWFNKMLIYFLPHKIPVRHRRTPQLFITCPDERRDSLFAIHYLYLFLTFSLFFDISHQNHPKTTSLFNRISHFLTTFYRFLSLFQRISANFPLHFRAKSAHFRNPLL